jgi:hypothetical protein
VGEPLDLPALPAAPATAPAPKPVEAAPAPKPAEVTPPPTVADVPPSLVEVPPPVAEAPAANPRPTSPRVASTPRPRSEAPARRFQRDARDDFPAPAAEADTLPPLPATAARPAPVPIAPPANDSSPAVPEAGSVAVAPASASEASSLSPDSLRDIEEIARLQDDAARRNPLPMNGLQTTQPSASASGGGGADPSAISRLELPRAPSPTEPRPIRVIPVPEEFVPLPPRQWEANRKYWAAAATCHMPLYFQDATLERYGQGVEQALGPAGRFFSYPLDDPRQSNQRNQLLQPMYSAGLFISQIALLPYNLIMDPPWEAEYDLGYYRPGDRIPADTYYLPRTGIGPPLRGRAY